MLLVLLTSYSLVPLTGILNIRWQAGQGSGIRIFGRHGCLLPPFHGVFVFFAFRAHQCMAIPRGPVCGFYSLMQLVFVF